MKTSLPRPEDFSKALYTFDIGQNDLHFGLKSMTEEQLKASFLNTIGRFAQAVKVKGCRKKEDLSSYKHVLECIVCKY